MKKHLLKSLIICSLLAPAFLSCQQSQEASSDVCRIHGTIPEEWNGVRVFLVPTTIRADASTVDSTVIENGKFEFVKDTTGIYDIRVDYHFRRGLQQLIVVTEPGDVQVQLGPTSSAVGTEQNDSLQAWKVFIEGRQSGFVALRDSLTAAGVSDDVKKARIEEYRQVARLRGKQMAENLKPGVLKDDFAKKYGKY